MEVNRVDMTSTLERVLKGIKRNVYLFVLCKFLEFLSPSHSFIVSKVNCRDDR